MKNCTLSNGRINHRHTLWVPLFARNSNINFNNSKIYAEKNDATLLASSQGQLQSLQCLELCPHPPPLANEHASLPFKPYKYIRVCTFNACVGGENPLEDCGYHCCSGSWGKVQKSFTRWQFLWVLIVSGSLRAEGTSVSLNLLVIDHIPTNYNGYIKIHLWTLD